MEFSCAPTLAGRLLIHRQQLQHLSAVREMCLRLFLFAHDTFTAVSVITCQEYLLMKCWHILCFPHQIGEVQFLYYSYSKACDIRHIFNKQGKSPPFT
jgi:hypothetical protein